jgi:hypothetical protein
MFWLHYVPDGICVCVCVCMYVCMYVYIYIYIYIHLCVIMCACVCTFECMDVLGMRTRGLFVFVAAWTCAHLHAIREISSCVCILSATHVRVHAHLCLWHMQYVHALYVLIIHPCIWINQFGVQGGAVVWHLRNSSGCMKACEYMQSVIGLYPYMRVPLTFFLHGISVFEQSFTSPKTASSWKAARQQLWLTVRDDYHVQHPQKCGFWQLGWKTSHHSCCQFWWEFMSTRQRQLRIQTITQDAQHRNNERRTHSQNTKKTFAHPSTCGWRTAKVATASSMPEYAAASWAHMRRNEAVPMSFSRRVPTEISEPMLNTTEHYSCRWEMYVGVCLFICFWAITAFLASQKKKTECRWISKGPRQKISRHCLWQQSLDRQVLNVCFTCLVVHVCCCASLLCWCPSFFGICRLWNEKAGEAWTLECI